MLSPRPPGRFIAAFVDCFVWAFTMVTAVWTTDTVARLLLSWSSPATVDHARDTVSILSVGFGAFLSNLCLAAFAANGRSPGKPLLGLRLVGADDDRPGWGRGLVRSSLQAGPYMGAFTVMTGLHDVFAGTRIVDPDERRPVNRLLDEVDDASAGVAPWKVGLALILHLFFAFVWMMIAAL